MTPVSNDSSLVPASVPPRDRIDSIDSLRGLALFGVLAVNLLTEFRVSIFQQFLSNDTPSKELDRLAETFVSFALESKAFSLFSILFGVSLAILLERLSQGNRPYRLLTRRLAALLAFGMLHLIFIWNGDILTQYALAGLIVLPLLRMPRCALAAAAVGLFGLYAALPLLPPLVTWPDSATLASHVATANHVYSTGTYLGIWRFSVRELALLLPLHVFVFPRTLALFLFGAFIWRSGILQNPSRHHRLLSSVAVSGVVAGIAWRGGSKSDAFSHWGAAGLVLEALAPILLAVGYGAVIISIAQSPRAQCLLAPFAAVGRMAFTNYILQSVIFGFVFFGYGLGLFGQLGTAAALLLGIVVYGLQALLSTTWLRRFRFGPRSGYGEHSCMVERSRWFSERTY